MRAQDLAKRDEIEQKRLEFARNSIEPQLAAKQATTDQLKQSAQLRQGQVEALHVRAGMAGVRLSVLAASAALPLFLPACRSPRSP